MCGIYTEVNPDKFNELANADVLHVFSFVERNTDFENYALYRGKLLSEHEVNYGIMRDRLNIYGKMFSCPTDVARKLTWFNGLVSHRITLLLSTHKVRWYHFGSIRRDLISYREELEAMRRFNHSL